MYSRAIAIVTTAIIVMSTSSVATQSTSPPILDASTREAVIEALIDKLNGYVDSQAVPRLTETLRNSAKAGQFEGVQEPGEFASALTRALRTWANDKHLSVYFSPQQSAAANPVAPARERYNYGFGRFERLSGNVGYLEILNFAPVETAKATGGSLLSLLSNFDAIILDLRRNGGGNTPMMAFVASYFFDTPVHLTSIYWRDTDTTVDFWSDPDVPGRRSPDQPLYILTSNDTFSAAEDFCYALQNLKRATIIGERTGGGAHSGKGLQRLTPFFTAFVPVGRSISPMTKSNWERTGVIPDLDVVAQNAAPIAHEHALKVLLSRETDERWKVNLENALRTLSK
jgi:hypothetical protein